MQTSITSILDQYKHQQGALLPILHAIQQACGYVPPDSIAEIATALNLSRAEVHGVISFYHEFRDQPGGRHRVQVCCAEACQSRGSRALESHVQSTLDLAYGDTSADGKISLEKVFCLGNCACGPSVRIDDDVFARVDESRFDQLLSDLDAQGDVL